MENKLYKSKKDIINISVRLLGLIGCFVGVFFSMQLYLNYYHDNNYLSCLIWAIVFFVIGLLGWKVINPLFKCIYVFRPTNLYIVTGKKETIIAYNKIMTVEKVKRIISGNGLALNQVKIEFLEEGTLKKVFLSPSNLDDFIKDLKINCKSMKIIKK